MNNQKSNNNELTLEQLEQVNGGDTPTTTLSLNYEKIEWTYRKDSNHDKWIDILAIDWGAHKP